LFAVLVSLVQMILTSVESAAKIYNKKVTKITVAAVVDIVTDTIFLHMVRKGTCLITISPCLLDPFWMRQEWKNHFQFATTKCFIERLDKPTSVFPARRNLKWTLKYLHLINKAIL